MKSVIKNFVKKLLEKSGRQIVSKDDWRRVKEDISVLRSLLKVNAASVKLEEGDSVAGIVFSKDRAIQLDALLRSYRKTVVDRCKLKLIYAYSGEKHGRAYDDVIESNRDVLAEVYCENNGFAFEFLLKKLIRNISTRKVFFLVDDIIFTQTFNLRVLVNLPVANGIISLRLGENLQFCYSNNALQPLPDLSKVNGELGLLSWRWQDGIHDWAYPLSVDGNIFNTEEIRALILNISFRNPNSLESVINRFRDLFLPRMGVCFKKSILVNIPCNLVQNEFQNIHGGLHQDVLLQKWFDGYRIDESKFSGFVNQSAHQEIDYSFILR